MLELLLQLQVMIARPLLNELIATKAMCTNVSIEACLNQAIDATTPQVNQALASRGLYSRVGCTIYEDFSGSCTYFLPGGNAIDVPMLDPDENACMTDSCVEAVAFATDFESFGRSLINSDVFYAPVPTGLAARGR